MADPATYEKHTTHTDTLGTILDADDPNERDAIHLAVFKATCGVGRLRPGEHVSLTAAGVAELEVPGQGVGIVDPFLDESVFPGEQFWLVVYPRQITSLRHVWEHPSFPPSGETSAPVPVPDEGAKAASEAWLRDWLMEHGDNPGFDVVVAVCRDGSWVGEDEMADWASGELDPYGDGNIHFRGVDAHGSIPPEFWDHMEMYLGRAFAPDDRADHFTCSC